MSAIEIVFKKEKDGTGSKAGVFNFKSRKNKATGKMKLTRSLVGEVEMKVKNPAVYLCSLFNHSKDLKAIAEVLSKACGFEVDQINAQKMIMERTFDSNDYKPKGGKK